VASFGEHNNTKLQRQRCCKNCTENNKSAHLGYYIMMRYAALKQQPRMKTIQQVGNKG
jgi:hypothetical protein